jgi:hypothetical protein
LVKRWVPENEQDILWAHTQKIRSLNTLLRLDDDRQYDYHRRRSLGHMSEEESSRKNPKAFDAVEDSIRYRTLPELTGKREKGHYSSSAYKQSSKSMYGKESEEDIAQESKTKASETRRATKNPNRDQKENVPSPNIIHEEPRTIFPTAPAQQSSVYDTATDQPAVPLPPLPPDWVSHRDETSGNIYYIHLPTQAVQWDFPSPGSMPSQSLPAPNYGIDEVYTGYYAQDSSPSPFQSPDAIVAHDDPDLEEAIKRSRDSFYSQPKVSDSTKLRGSKSKASKSSGKGSSTGSEIGSETSSASKKARESNPNPLLTFLAGGRKR